MRKQVLGSRGLELGDFDDVDAAMAAADVIITQFQAKYPQKVVAHPNQMYDDHPQLDQFWFAEYKGVPGETFILFMCLGRECSPPALYI
jgi:hypothetical protein